MPEFLRLSPPMEALQTLLQALPDWDYAIETVDTVHSLGRVLAGNVHARHPLPEFPRSTVDGYALRARDTFGVSESLPGYLSLLGEVPMGAAPELSLEQGTCALIHTGGMLPDGADAVTMLEHTQKIYKGNLSRDPGAEKLPLSVLEIEVTHAVVQGENVLQVGEDVAREQIVLSSGTRIRPVEIGGCMALGITKLRVAAKPKIGILSSGDEVVPPEKSPGPGQVRDVNTYSLAALVDETGGEPVLYGIVPDSLTDMNALSAKALIECNAVVVTAGSSASSRDTTAEAISLLGPPGILVHGINVRPGKPTILAVCNGKAVIGLPGNPVSALVIAGLFVVPIINRLLGLTAVRPKPSVRARLTVNLPSQSGREDWIAVKLLVNSQWKTGNEEERFIADPVFGKSNLIFSLARADGLVRIPPDATGLSAGETVEVVSI